MIRVFFLFWLRSLRMCVCGCDCVGVGLWVVRSQVVIVVVFSMSLPRPSLRFFVYLLLLVTLPSTSPDSFLIFPGYCFFIHVCFIIVPHVLLCPYMQCSMSLCLRVCVSFVSLVKTKVRAAFVTAGRKHEITRCSNVDTLL